MKNSQEKQENLISEFLITDKNGVVHNAILAGVLTVLKYTEDRTEETSVQKKNATITTITEWEDKCVFKSLDMGLAITHSVDDVYNLEYGTRRAIGRALKPSKRVGRIRANDRSMLGHDMCQAIMDQQISFIKNNQDLFLKIKPAPLSEEFGESI